MALHSFDRSGPKKAPTRLVEELHLDPVGIKVREVLLDVLGVDPEEMAPESALVEDLGADSLDVVEITMGLEDAFGLAEIDPFVAETFVRVRDVVAYVRKHAKNSEGAQR